MPSSSGFGRRTALQIGALGAAAAALALVAVDGYPAVVVTGFVLAGIAATVAPNVDAIALEHLGQARMHEYGRIRAWESLSYAATCLAAGVLLQRAGIRWSMVVYAIGSLVMFAWSVVALAPDRPEREAEHGRLGAVGAVFRAAPRFWVFLLAFGGGAGYALTRLGSSDLVAAAGAIGIGWAAGAIAVLVVNKLRTHSVSSEVEGKELVGATGMLLLPVGPGRPGKVRIATDTRAEFPREIEFVPQESLSAVDPCTLVGAITEDRGSAIWKVSGGTARKRGRGMGGPDLSMTADTILSVKKGCESDLFFVGAAEGVEWGLVYDLAASGLALEKAQLKRAVVPSAPLVAGNRVQL